MPRIDFTQIGDVQDFTPVPTGSYVCRVAKVEETNTKSGDEMWGLRFEIAEGKNEGRHIFDNMVFSEKQVFSDVMLASRRLAPVEKLAAEIEQMHGRKLKTAQVDADDVPALTKLIESYGPQVVINVALPYQDLHIMDACLNAGVDYLDTANYEPPDVAKFEYKWQWAYQDRFGKAVAGWRCSARASIRA